METTSLIPAIVSLLVLHMASSEGGISEFESALHSDLLESYNKVIQPDRSPEFKVKVGLNVIEIVNPDIERTQSIPVFVHFKGAWNDKRLRWDPSKYGNLSQTFIDASRMWKPDLFLYNSGTSNIYNVQGELLFVVQSSGAVTAIIPTVLKASCDLHYDVKLGEKSEESGEESNFADCKLKVGSWVRGGDLMNLTLGSADTSTYRANPCLNLLGVDATRNKVFYDCCPAPYIDISITFRLGLQEPRPKYCDKFVEIH